jgi:hypothetical protein
MKRARFRWTSSTPLHRSVTIATLMLLITWIVIYVVGSAAANGTGYLDTNTSVVVVVLGLMVLVFAVWNLVLGLRLTARLNANESSARDE